MAADWIKMKRGLRHDPKVIAMARHLENSPAFAQSCVRHVTEPVTLPVTLRVTFAFVTRVTVCALLDVWASLNNTLSEDGKAPFMRLQDIDDIVEIPGFGEAMQSVGWVRELDDAGLVFPNFSENNSPSKSRSGNAKSEAERAKAYRDKKRAERDQGSTVTPSRHVTTEKRREEKSIKVSTNVDTCPIASDDAEILQMIWESVPAQSRERSSKKQLASAWRRILVKNRPSAEILQNALAAWNLSRAWKKGFSEGCHRWVQHRRWESLPEAAPEELPIFNKTTPHKGIQEKIEVKRL